MNPEFEKQRAENRKKLIGQYRDRVEDIFWQLIEKFLTCPFNDEVEIEKILPYSNDELFSFNVVMQKINKEEQWQFAKVTLSRVSRGDVCKITAKLKSEAGDKISLTQNPSDGAIMAKDKKKGSSSKQGQGKTVKRGQAVPGTGKNKPRGKK